MKRIISLVLCAILILCSFCFASTAADIMVTGATVVDLGIPTLGIFPVNGTYANARSVWSVAEYEGKIYIGCGNFDKNAGTGVGGSIPVYSYDPATGQWTEEYTVKDEQISRFYNEWGNLYISGTDPTTSGQYGNVYYKENGVWATNSEIYRGIHIFDMQFMEDGRTVFAGLGTNYSVQPYASRSVDGGKTWSLIRFKRNGAVITGASGVFYRTYNLFEYKGEVYATLWVSEGGNAEDIGLYKYNSVTGYMDYYAPTHANLCKNTMTVGSDFTFNGSFVSVYNGFYVFSDDLKSWEEPVGYSGIPVCARVIGNAVYMTSYSVTETGVVSYLYKTTDLSSFERIAAVKLNDSYALSFTYHEGLFYMGTSWSLPESQTNGTVFALKVEKADCTHGNLITETEQATCTEDGLKTESCPDCGYCDKTVLAAYGHSYPSEWTAIAASSCTGNGLEQRECENCGEIEGRAIPALGHSFSAEYTVDQALTCTQNEQKSRHCERCEEMTDVITTRAPGHHYVDYVCTVCKATQPYRPGDANGDTLVNILDMTVTARYIVQRGYEGTFDLSGCDMSAADLNADGVIDQLDLNDLASLIL